MTERYISIDIFRGFSMVMVICSHVFWGLCATNITLEMASEDIPTLFFGFFSSIGQLFYLVSGFSMIVSIRKDHEIKNLNSSKIFVKHTRRGFLLIITGSLLDTLVYFHVGHVDTLHLLGIADIIVSFVFLKLMKTKKNPNWLLFIGLLIIVFSPVARLLIGYPVIDPNAEILVYYKSPETLVEFVQAWFTTSFFPIFPYLAYFFIGAWIACNMQRYKSDGRLSRRFDNRTMLFGAISFISGLLITMIFEESFPEILTLPQWEQSWWMIEISFNIQPLTTTSFFIYLGFSTFCISILHRIFDVVHDEPKRVKIEKIYLKIRLDKIVNNLYLFSKYSFTIYILQYLWIPIFRFFGIMYSIEDAMIRMGLCIVAVLFWTMVVKIFEKRKLKTLEYYMNIFMNS